MDKNYERYIEDACKLLGDLEGALLEQVLINTVQDEFNVVYLKTSKGNFCLHGESGGEYLGIRNLIEVPKLTNEDGYAISTYPPFQQFEGHEIVKVRQIGTAWNGHGFEFNFKGLHTISMLVQSVYCGSAPDNLDDCLRLGIGMYQNKKNLT
ncbi:hypothetical protein [Veronia pacifica]|uniref:Uncharacterized protein n=1 Tax=Veronia pacifica TaxID=1080227 RepID=A0A1C3EJ88_9GAMM|nr:hypothetical protein [Veronia pacifica]ODA33306.1 hypothetical protein A8L45_10940 [Veronia pacifica]